MANNFRLAGIGAAVVAAAGLGVCAIAVEPVVKRCLIAGVHVGRQPKSVEDRVAQYGAAVRARLAPAFERAGVSYPPQAVTLIGLKAERRLEVWVKAAGGRHAHLKDYPILGMSGTLGPKLREGDLQAPEGLYRLELLNPNSLYHLSLRVNYPNEDDRRRGKEDGRAKLGSDIMIHGKTCSVGCLAMGDEAAEELFVLAAETGVGQVAIILSPVDFRVSELPADMPPTPAWTGELYAAIRQALARYAAAAPARPPAPRSVR